MITAVDEFILYDDMQYTCRDWRDRNQIKTLNGLQWLFVVVKFFWATVLYSFQYFSYATSGANPLFCRCGLTCE